MGPFLDFFLHFYLNFFTEVSDVPKTEPAVSQGNQAHANSMLPAYCDPPNPCPLGYTAADGCIEDFENTSEFSRRYQVISIINFKNPFAIVIDGKCVIDFCRLLKNVFATRNICLIAPKKTHTEEKRTLLQWYVKAHLLENGTFMWFMRLFQNILAGIPGIDVSTGENPYLEGHKLPVAAKKGMFWTSYYNPIISKIFSRARLLLPPPMFFQTKITTKLL